MEPTETQNKSNSSRVVVYIIIVIVVLLGIWWLMSADRNGGLGTGNEEVTELSPGETLRTAGEGNIVTGFPSELILESGVVASESYSINYSNQGVDQPVVAFMSNWTLEQNIQEYSAYLMNNGWEISHEASMAEAPVTFFYATRGNQDVNITFNDVEGEGVDVTIAVANKGGVTTSGTGTTSDTE